MVRISPQLVQSSLGCLVKSSSNISITINFTPVLWGSNAVRKKWKWETVYGNFFIWMSIPVFSNVAINLHVKSCDATAIQTAIWVHYKFKITGLTASERLVFIYLLSGCRNFATELMPWKSVRKFRTPASLIIPKLEWSLFELHVSRSSCILVPGKIGDRILNWR